MSDVASFGNIVNSLRAVRNDYNEHLKTVAQYEAFLLVESSTQKVTDTLQGIIASAAPSMASEVVATLELAKSKFREHLTSVPEYRALLAIDKLIADVADDLGVQPAPVAAADQAEPAQVELEPVAVQAVATTEAEVAAPETQETAQVAAPAREPVDEAAIAIASITEAVSAQPDTAEEAHAVAETAAEVVEEAPAHEAVAEHQEATVQPPAPKFVAADTIETVAHAAIEPESSPVAMEAPGHEAEAAPVLGAVEVEAVAAHAAEHQETATSEADIGHTPSQPVVIIAEETSEPLASAPSETHGHETEKAA